MTGSGYQEIKAKADRLLPITRLPGLWLNPPTLWNGDLPALAATVQHGVGSNEHAVFLRDLTARKR